MLHGAKRRWVVLWGYAVCSATAATAAGADWEHTMVDPDEEAILDGEDYLIEGDPRLNADQFSFDLETGFDESLAQALNDMQEAADVTTATGLAEELFNKDEVDAFAQGDDGFGNGGGLIGLFATAPGDGPIGERVLALEAWEAFVALSKSIADWGVRVAFTVDENLVRNAHVGEGWAIVAVQPSLYADSAIEPIRGGKYDSFHETLVREYVLDRLVPKVGEITYDNEAIYHNLGLPVVLAYANLGDGPEGREEIRDFLRELSKRVSADREETHKIVYAVVDRNLDVYMLRYFSAEIAFRTKAPRHGFRLAVRAELSRYFAQEKLTLSTELSDGNLESAARFVKDALNENIPPVVLSGQIEQAARGDTVRDEL